MKACTSCFGVKPFEAFHKRADAKDGHAHACIECRKVEKKIDYEKNKEKRLATVAAYRAANPEKASAAKRAAYLKKHSEYKEKSRAKYVSNREEILARMSDYRAANPELIKERHRAYNFKNRISKVAKQKVYYLSNKTKVDEYRRRYARERAKSDPLYALARLVRRRISIALADRGYPKEGRTGEMLGCTYAELKGYLERLFSDGMSWENRGSWHVDHRVPLASATSREEMLALCHFTNLQPLWAFDNLSKGAKMAPILKAA